MCQFNCHHNCHCCCCYSIYNPCQHCVHYCPICGYTYCCKCGFIWGYQNYPTSISGSNTCNHVHST